MIGLLLFYKFSLGIAFLSGGVLSVIGHHLILRAKVLEIFALSQMALLGNLLFHPFGELAGLLASLIFFAMGKIIIGVLRLETSSFSNAMIGLYLLLMSLQHLLVGLFPQWEAALRVGVFGNVVTAGTGDHVMLGLVFFLFLIVYFYCSREISLRSLNICIFGTKNGKTFDWLVLLLPLVVSLYGLGLLFTLGFLLLPGILIGSDFDNQKNGMKVLFCLSSLSSFAGLVLSILFEKVGTTPLQVIILFVSCIVLKTIILMGSQKNLST